MIIAQCTCRGMVSLVEINPFIKKTPSKLAYCRLNINIPIELEMFKKYINI